MTKSLVDFYSLFTENSLAKDLFMVKMIGTITLVWFIVPLVFVLVYYFLSPISKIFKSRLAWLVWLIICAAIVIIIEYSTFTGLASDHVYKVKSSPSSGFKFDQGVGVFLSFTFFLGLFSAVAFLLLSILFKRFSKYKFTTPF